MELTGATLGVASEGSFGPHPSLFFINADEEIVIFIDLENKLEIIAKELSSETNFSGQPVTSKEELLGFAKAALFPTHGLILKQSQEDAEGMVKGITNKMELLNSFEALQVDCSPIYVETDMRALYNPSRMKVIEAATKKLVSKIQSNCPSCQMPGFDIVDRKSGLPCQLCGSPTKSTLSFLYKCQHCDHEEEKHYPNGKKEEDPMYCDFCNP
mgnify:CR=1 FL=1